MMPILNQYNFPILQIVLAECEKKKEQLWITKDFSVTAQVILVKILTFTVQVKSKLTVPRASIFETQDLRLDHRKF